MSKVTIVSNGGRVVGSKVLVDGVPMKGVFKIELQADARTHQGASPLWTAVIHCHPEQIEVTDMDSSEVEFVRGKRGASKAELGALFDRAISDAAESLKISDATMRNLQETWLRGLVPTAAPTCAAPPHLPEAMPSGPPVLERILDVLTKLLDSTRRARHIGLG